MAKRGNLLLDALRENDASRGKKAKGYFLPTANRISYPTGFPELDYKLGYTVIPKNGEPYTNLGVASGTYVLCIGKSSTGKSSFVIEAVTNIIRPFFDKGGFIIHFDNERATTYQRIHSLTDVPIEELEASYVINQTKVSVDDMKSTIYDIYKEKTENRSKYEYDTGKLNEFGEPIKMLVPTGIIIDSIANLTKNFKEQKDEENAEIGSQTDRLRLTGDIGRFLHEIMNFLNEANIILFAVNHIMINPQLGVIKSPSEMLYLKQDETLPGGRTQFNVAHLVLKFVAVGSEKYDKSEEGFNGFMNKIEIIKSRTNADGKTLNIIYDKETGHSPIRSTVESLHDYGLVSGNKNGYYFTNDPNKNKFVLATMEESFNENPELYRVMIEAAKPIYSEFLGTPPGEGAHENMELMNGFYD
jgi:hypothetical protein